MTKAFEVTASIDRPIDEVWTRLTDWPRAHEWMPGVGDMRADGSRLIFRARGAERTSQITALDPGCSITLTSVHGPVTAAYTYTCEPSGAGTRVILVVDCRVTGAWKLAGVLLRAAMKRADGGQLNALKTVIESKGSHV